MYIKSKIVRQKIPIVRQTSPRYFQWHMGFHSYRLQKSYWQLLTYCGRDWGQ